MRKIAMIPLITFDALVNVYLTVLFLIPLSSLYSFKNSQQTSASVRLRTIAFRTFIGSLCTLISSIVNLTVLMVLDGEPGWVCLMCCNSDILFSAIVIQWITSKDNSGTTGKSESNSRNYTEDPGTLGSRAHRQSLTGALVKNIRSSFSGFPHDGSSNKAIPEDVAGILPDNVEADLGSRESDGDKMASSISEFNQAHALRDISGAAKPGCLVTVTITRGESETAEGTVDDAEIESDDLGRRPAHSRRIPSVGVTTTITSDGARRMGRAV